MLPPARAALLPDIICANYVTMRDKSYLTDCPELPAIDENGWNLLESGCYIPVKCLALPAPKAILEIIKCVDVKQVVKVGVAAESIPCLARHSVNATGEIVQIL